jgi:hypothetical protein
MKETIAASFLPVIAPAITTIIAWLVSMLLIEAKKFVKTKTKNAAVNNAMERISHTVETTVDELNQTMAADLKEKSDDGKFTNDVAKDLKTKAFRIVLAQLPDALKEDAKLGVNCVYTLIRSKIEQSLLKQKVTKSMVSSILSTDGIPVSDIKGQDTKHTVLNEASSESTPTCKDNLPVVDQGPTVDKGNIAIEDIAKMILDLVHLSRSGSIVNAG